MAEAPSSGAAVAPGDPALSDAAAGDCLAIPDKPYTFTGRVTYTSEREAQMVRNALAVDPELRPEAVYRELTVEGSTMVMRFAAVDVRTLRAAVGTFCDLLGLATRTLEAFGHTAKD